MQAPNEVGLRPDDISTATQLRQCRANRHTTLEGKNAHALQRQPPPDTGLCSSRRGPAIGRPNPGTEANDHLARFVTSTSVLAVE